MNKLPTIRHLALALTMVVLVAIPTMVYAQSTQPGVAQRAGEISDTGLIDDVFVKIGYVLVGEGIGPLPEAHTEDEQGRELYLQGGPDSNSSRRAALPMVNQSMLAVLTSPPASGEQYVARAIHKINPASPVYAQGYGFAVSEPVLGIWSAALSVSYALFTLAFLVVGFAIMFRAKLNAQVVVNIQMALPRMVITLVLISLSYAIAGFMIDLMYITTLFAVELFRSVIFEEGLNSHTYAKTWAFRNIFQTFGGFIIGTGGMDSIVSRAATAISVTIGDVILGPGEGVVQDVFSWITSILFFIIFAVVMLVNSFKVFFALLGSYIQILLHIITAPLQLLLNIYPGSNAFMKWLKNITANVAVFPVVAVMILLVYTLMGQDTQEGVGFKYYEDGVAFTPPLLGGIQTEAFQGLIGLGVLMMIPKAVEMTKAAFGIQEKDGGIFGSALAPVMGVGTAALAGVKGLAGMGINTYKQAGLAAVAEGFAGQLPGRAGVTGLKGAAYGVRRALNPKALYRDRTGAVQKQTELRKQQEYIARAEAVKYGYEPEIQQDPHKVHTEQSVDKETIKAKDTNKGVVPKDTGLE